MSPYCWAAPCKASGIALTLSCGPALVTSLLHENERARVRWRSMRE